MKLLDRPAPVVREPAVGPRRRRLRLRLGWPSEGTVVFCLSAAAYLSAAVYFVLIRHSIFGDALSRVANAQYVVSSRDPHLASIGFVWNPLPSLVLVPFVPLRGLIPVFFTTGFIGSIASALFMAGAVALLRGTLADLGVDRLFRLLLTAAFALHPMIVIYAYNGMSEAPLLFFIVLTSRHLLRWIADREPRELMLVGMSLGGAYLVRYEALAAGLAVIGFVVVITALGTRGPWPVRRSAAFSDGAVVGLPFLLSFGLWAAIARIIVKQWFPTLQSEYGNTAQVAGSRKYIDEVTGAGFPARLSYAAHQLLGLEPLIAVLLVLVLVLAAIRRDFRGLAPVAVAGAVLAFDALALLTGKSFGWLRFQIAVIPLAFLLAGVLVALVREWRWVRWVSGTVALALLLPAFATSAATLLDRRLAREETEVVRGVVVPSRSTQDELRNEHKWEASWQVAAYIDSNPAIRRGQVLADAAFAFPVLLASRHTDKYVITPDQDFKPKLADPITFHVSYMLVPDPESASFDALNVAYPTLFKDGFPGGELVREWKNPAGKAQWRLYRLPKTSTTNVTP
jgi:hypothetical protein